MGLNGRAVGLDYEFKYSLTRKSRTFEDQFFRFLARTGTPGNPTVYQTAYNNQANNLLDVTGPVLYIDGPTVERWLENNANPRTNGYTVYFINWYGRQDFKFHAYTKTGDPDPDTGVDFGELQSSAIAVVGRDSIAELVLRFLRRTRMEHHELGRRCPGSRWRRLRGLPDAADLGIRRQRLPRRPTRSATTWAC